MTHLFQVARAKAERVGVAEFKVSNDPQIVLVSTFLGMGIGLSAQDPTAGVGGLLVVPMASSTTREPAARLRPALFVDTAIPAFLEALSRLGAQGTRLVICLGGAAHWLSRAAAVAGGPDIFSAALDRLSQHRLSPSVQQRSAIGDVRWGLEIATGEVRAQVSGQSRLTVLWKNSTAT